MMMQQLIRYGLVGLANTTIGLPPHRNNHPYPTGARSAATADPSSGLRTASANFS